MARKYIPGAIVDTPNGRIKVISVKPGKRLKDKRLVHPRAVIEILETGTVLDVQTTNIATGHFKDYRKPTVYGVGYIGSTIKIPPRSSGSVIRRLYDLWTNMLKRAYMPYKGSYTGVTVDKRWHNFTHFLNTIQLVPGYLKWERMTNKRQYALDKDIKIPGNKMYSMDRCMFVPQEENIRDSARRRRRGTNASTLTPSD